MAIHWRAVKNSLRGTRIYLCVRGLTSYTSVLCWRATNLLWLWPKMAALKNGSTEKKTIYARDCQSPLNSQLWHQINGYDSETQLGRQNDSHLWVGALARQQESFQEHILIERHLHHETHQHRPQQDPLIWQTRTSLFQKTNFASPMAQRPATCCHARFTNTTTWNISRSSFPRTGQPTKWGDKENSKKKSEKHIHSDCNQVTWVSLTCLFYDHISNPNMFSGFRNSHVTSYPVSWCSI